MVDVVVKRDGRRMVFDKEKIKGALFKAFKASNYANLEETDAILKTILVLINEQYEKEITVEEVQNIVEDVLLELGYQDIAKRYIIYRNERTKMREMNTSLMRTFCSMTFDDEEGNNLKRENANVNGETAMGMMLKYGSEGAKDFYKKFILDKRYAKAHDDGYIHIHDLDFYNFTTTCCQIDLTKLFKGGFSVSEGFLREPNSIQTYASLACIAIQSNQNDQHGGQSICNFDFDMAEGVKKTYYKHYKRNLQKAISLYDEDFKLDEIYFILSKKYPVLDQNNGVDEQVYQLLEQNFTRPVVEKIMKFVLKNSYEETNQDTYQAMESLIHNLNSMHSRAGAQVPFSSLNYGTDTSSEGRMVIKNLLLSTERGLGDGSTPIFPIQIFKVKEGINYNIGDPNYDLLQLSFRVSSKRLFPNYSFLDSDFNKMFYKEDDPKTEVAYMGCRTRVMGNIFSEYEKTPGRGNLSFTSINLPRLALEAQGNLENFYQLLDEYLNLVAEQLYERFKIQISKRVYNFPFLMGQGVWHNSENLKYDDTLYEVLKHGSLTVGFIGLAETLKVLTGYHHGESEKAQNLGLDIISYMRKKMDLETVKRHLNYALIATPAEGLSGRFVKIDRKIYGVIEGVTNHEYYTNSFHIPVYYPISAFKKISLEAPYHKLTNGGHISYVELDGNLSQNPEAFETIIRHMHDCNIGYGSINHPVDRDPVCGYNGVINDVCPKCGRKENVIKFERIRRITGYLVGTLERFNNAKYQEVLERVKHNVKHD